MSNKVYQLSDQELRYDQASLWVAKMDKELTEDETHQLQRWMADPDNRAVLMAMARLWDKMDALSRLSGLFPVPAQRRIVPPWRPAFALAASILLVVVVGAGLWLYSGFGTPLPGTSVLAQRVYETAIGEHSTINLPDGSQIMLNTNSRVAVDYSRQQRLLTLARGEVHFIVAKDPDRPLRVVAGDHIVQALGTAFNIEITEQQQIELVVTEGKVSVTVYQPEPLPDDITTPARKPDAPSRAPAKALATPTIVSAGEGMIVNAPEPEITPISPDDIEVRLSWRSGNLVFRGESLEEAVKEVTRYTAVEFVILDNNLKQVRVAGLFRAGDVAGLLATLRENFNIVSQRLDENTILLSSN